MWLAVRDRLAATRIEIYTPVDQPPRLPWELLCAPPRGPYLALQAREFVRAPIRPAPAPQIHSATVTAVETVRAADQLALPVTGLPATGGAITVSN